VIAGVPPRKAPKPLGARGVTLSTSYGIIGEKMLLDAMMCEMDG
jgi:hypothetical protein